MRTYLARSRCCGERESPNLARVTFSSRLHVVSLLAVCAPSTQYSENEDIADIDSASDQHNSWQGQSGLLENSHQYTEASMHSLQKLMVFSCSLRLLPSSPVHSRRQTRVSDAVFPVRKEGQRPGRCLGPYGIRPSHPAGHITPVCGPLSRFSATRHSFDQDTRRGQRVWQKNSTSEGNWQGASGRRTKPNAPRWRSRFRPQAQRLQYKAQPQGHSNGNEGSIVRQT